MLGNNAEQIEKRERGLFSILRRMEAPVVHTPITGTVDDTVIMAFPRSVKSSFRHVAADYVRWTALKESFRQSGARIYEVSVQPDDPHFLLWMRDPCVIVDGTAFFPDVDILRKSGLTNMFLPNKIRSLEVAKERMAQIGLKIVEVRDAYFDGGNIVPDHEEGILFYGDDRNLVVMDSVELLAEDIYWNTGKKYEAAYIPTHSQQYYHLDIGCSPRLPDGRYIVAEDLGPDCDGSGYRTLEKYLGKNRILKADAETGNMGLCNMEVIGNVVFMPACPDRLREELEDAGLTVNAPRSEDLRGTCFSLADEFSAVRQIGTGGVHCMTNSVQSRFLSLG